MRSDNKELLISTLHTLKMLINDSTTIVAEHLNSLVPNLLLLTKFKESLVTLYTTKDTTTQHSHTC